MPQDESPTTSKDDRSAPATSPAEPWWVVRTRPSRQQNLTPWERQSLAITLRMLRRANSALKRGDMRNGAEIAWRS
jgi:hypothetical protein